MALGNTQIGEKQRERLGLHHRATVGMDVQFSRLNTLLTSRFAEQLFGNRRRLGRGDLPANDEAAKDVQNEVEAEPGSLRGPSELGVSGPEESHLRALAEPDVNLSAHPAPITEPQMRSLLANAQIGESDATQCARPT